MRSLDDDQIAEMKRRIEAGEPKAKVARDFGINRENVYKYLHATR